MLNDYSLQQFIIFMLCCDHAVMAVYMKVLYNSLRGSAP